MNQKINKAEIHKKYGNPVFLFNKRLLNSDTEGEKEKIILYATWHRFVMLNSKQSNNAVFCLFCYSFMNRGRKNYHVAQNPRIVTYKEMKTFEAFLEILLKEDLAFKNEDGFLLITERVGIEEGKKKRGFSTL